MKKVYPFLLLCLMFIGGTTFTHAQEAGGLFDTILNESDVELEMTPSDPDPRTEVMLRLRSDSIDLNRYMISWFSNGNVVKKGTGERTITVTVPDYGKTLDIQVVIDLPDTSIRKTLRLAPEDTTLLWEAVDAYVPAFYRGKKLPAKESIVRAVAIPNFSGTSATYTSPKKDVYIWKRNGQAMTQASGYGKDSLLIKHNKLRAIESIEVTTSNADHSKESVQETLITPTNPRIVLYEENTSSGMFRAARDNRLTTSTSTTTLVAEPYFFSKSTKGSFDNLVFSWTLNRKPMENAQGKSLLVAHPSENGLATFGLTIQNTLTNLQQVSKNFDIVFR